MNNGSRILIAMGAIIVPLILTSILLWTQERRPAPSRQATPTVAAEVELPEPVSGREILHNLNDRPGARLAGSYKGFVGERELKVDQGRVSLAGEEQRIVKIFGFKEDARALVLQLEGDRFVYLKEKTLALDAYPQPMRGLTGWLIQTRRQKPLAVVMVEDVQDNWPRRESLQPAEPAPLPY